jgi:hypothetical protein
MRHPLVQVAVGGAWFLMGLMLFNSKIFNKAQQQQQLEGGPALKLEDTFSKYNPKNGEAPVPAIAPPEPTILKPSDFK